MKRSIPPSPAAGARCLSHDQKEEEHADSKVSWDTRGAQTKLRTRILSSPTSQQYCPSFFLKFLSFFVFFLLLFFVPSRFVIVRFLPLSFLQVCSAPTAPPSWCSQPWFCAFRLRPLNLKTPTRTRTWTWKCVTSGCCSAPMVPDGCHR